MVEGISGVIGRISEIGARIEEIKSLGKNSEIKGLKPEIKDNNNENSGNQKTFNEILKQVLDENGSLQGADNSGETDSLSGSDIGKINRLIGNKKESEEMLKLLYQNLRSENKNTEISNTISEASGTYGVDRSLIKAVIKQESEYDNNATSPKGAMGLMQIMPETAGLLGISDPYNTHDNIIGGTKYLKMLLNKYNNNLNLALAAYNAGPGVVDKYGDIPPYDETQNYVKQVLKYYNEFKNFE